MNKNNFYTNIFILTCILNLQANEINKEFINSIPSDIKKDVMDEINQNFDKTEIDNKNYSAFDSKINLKETFIEEKIEDFSNLKVFGNEFFQSFPSTFMPINDPSANPNYILDVDDTISVQVIKGELQSQEYRIERDGSIFMPEIGKINLAGLTLENGNKVVNSLVQDYFIDSEVIVSLKSVRDIQILVTGEVNFPGIYTLGGYSSALHAISSSGGIKNTGSFREIFVKRNGKIINTLDLYDIFINADTSKLSSLRSGDSVLIPASNNQIRVVGAVNRPSIYEFKEGETIEQIIRYAGGISNNSQDGEYYVSREDADSKLYKLSSITNLNMKVVRNDKIFVPYKEFNRDSLQFDENNLFIDKPIKLSGAVKNPGLYYLSENKYLSDLIDLAGGYKNNAYPFGGVLINGRAKELENEYNERLYKEAIKSLASLATSNKSPNIENILPLISEFKNIKSSGRIVTEFNLDVIENHPLKNTLLSQGDEIYIPYKKNVIYIFGEVLNPGTIIYKPNFKAKDYIELVGGFNDAADKNHIIVVQANGEAHRLKSIRNIFSQADRDIKPGAVIYVTRDLSQINALGFASELAPVISSMAISLASLNAIQKNQN